MSLQDHFIESSEITEVDVEDQIMDAELAQEALDEIHFQLNDIERLENLQQTLESLEAIVSSIECATAKEIALIKLTTNASLAGTGISSEKILPSLESSEGFAISTEGIGDFISKIWKAIVNAFKRVWDAILSFFGILKKQTDTLKKNVDNTRDRMGDIANKKLKERDVAIETGAEYLAINGSVVKNGDELIQNLRICSAQTNVVYIDYVKQLELTGNELITALNRFNLEKPVEGLQGVIDASRNLSLDGIRTSLSKMGKDKHSDIRWESMGVVEGPALLGSKCLYHITSNAKLDNNTLFNAEIERKRQFIFEYTKKGADNKIKTAVIKTVTSEQGIEICGLLKQIIENVSNFDQYKDRLDKIRKNIIKAGDDLEKQAKITGDNIPDNVALFVQEALKFVDTYSKWVASPMADMGKHMLNVCRASVAYCNKSAEKYE